VRSLITRAHDTAKRILSTHKAALKALAATLVEKETLEQEEFLAVLKPFKIKPMGV